jgi:hypothetical protein
MDWKGGSYRREPIMSESGEWYPHYVWLVQWKCETAKAPRIVYYRVSSELWHDMLVWLNMQEDAEKI